MAEEILLHEWTSFQDPFQGRLLEFIMPQACSEAFFLRSDFADGPCMKTLLSKGLGTVIILGSMLAASDRQAAGRQERRGRELPVAARRAARHHGLAGVRRRPRLPLQVRPGLTAAPARRRLTAACLPAAPGARRSSSCCRRSPSASWFCASEGGPAQVRCFCWSTRACCSSCCPRRSPCRRSPPCRPPTCPPSSSAGSSRRPPTFATGTRASCPLSPSPYCSPGRSRASSPRCRKRATRCWWSRTWCRWLATASSRRRCSTTGSRPKTSCAARRTSGFARPSARDQDCPPPPHTHHLLAGSR
ncbi:uncharacterized protein LOC133494713 isoform X1 [Syngnathoides biaculeatus]|uniref:uncharacterized protein LOC133494713 isoform X1 n=1 Tax=Syngnathoides biaculeatus TaxID=300417 RepID=UPI002ADD33EF|nr:uncharacterized protein LOC133494713 isoform X1 [Syngnathoides biaculeatus]